MKILLVDDDAFLRDMYATKFAESNHEVVTADSATIALQKLKSDTFDVMLLDMLMPGMGGVELIETAYAANPDMQMKSIVLSNLGQEADVADAEKAGASGYIIKAKVIPSDVVKQVEQMVTK